MDKPNYRVMAVDPKMGDIDEQFALIETKRKFGSPASASDQRKIRVGDSLPEGEVTAITAEGIKVIPDKGDEFIIPVGNREGYKPPEGKKTIEPFYSSSFVDRMMSGPGFTSALADLEKMNPPLGDAMSPRQRLSTTEELISAVEDFGAIKGLTMMHRNMRKRLLDIDEDQ